MIKKVPLIIIFLSVFSFAQNLTGDDFGYIETMQNKLNLKFELDNDVESFKYDDEIISYTVKPNTHLRTSIAANYRFLTLRIGYSPKFLESDDSALKGNTKVFKLNLSLFIKNWMQTFSYNSTKGYYIDDYLDTSQPVNLIQDDIVILPTLGTKSFSATTSYKFNDDFSFKAIYNQFEIQRKSAGSFIPSFTYTYFSLSDKESPQDLNISGAILNASYFYTFVINKKWYSSLGISPGLGMEFNKLQTMTDEGLVKSSNHEMVFNINSLVGIGYNSRSFFGGLALKGIATTRSENSVINFNTQRSSFVIFVGYRFKSPKFMEDSFDWVDDQNPF